MLTLNVSGGAGTTVTAFKAAVPQIVVGIAESCPDQIIQGSIVERLGCGKHLKPRIDVNQQSFEDVVLAVEDMSRDLTGYRRNVSWSDSVCGKTMVPQGA